MARAGHSAVARDRVVDGVQTGGAYVAVEQGHGVGPAGQVADQVVEAGQQLVGGKVDIGQRAYGGAQPPHGRRGLDAVAHDVADDQGDPGAGQRNDVEPVAADPGPGAGGQIAGGDVQGRLLGKTLRQQAALQREGGVALAGVAPGVVDAHGGAGGDLLAQQQVVLLEALGPAVAGERGHAQGEATRTHGYRQHRVEPEPPHAFGPLGCRPVQVLQGGGREVLDERPAHGQALRRGGTLRVGRHRAVRHHGFGAALQNRLGGDPAQHHRIVRGALRRILTSLDRRQEIDRDEVREPWDGHVGEFLSGTGQVQGAADPQAGVVDQDEPLPCEVLLRHVVCRQQDTFESPVGVPHRDEGHRPDALPLMAGEVQCGAELLETPGLQRGAHALLGPFALRVEDDLRHPQATHLRLGQAHHPLHVRVRPAQPQSNVVQGHRGGSLGETAPHERVVLGGRGRPGHR